MKLLLRQDLRRHVVGDVDVLFLQEHKCPMRKLSLVGRSFREFLAPSGSLPLAPCLIVAVYVSQWGSVGLRAFGEMALLCLAGPCGYPCRYRIRWLALCVFKLQQI